MNYRSYEDLNTTIKDNLSKLHAEKFDLVVGIPRSGMVPAFKIALFLNLHCTDIESFLLNSPLKKGSRPLKAFLEKPQDATNILLVDDSILSGNSLEKTKNKIPLELRSRIKTLAIYATKDSKPKVDLHFELCSIPRLFEWNIFHSNHLEKTSFDLDGVLCQDPTEAENDDGKRYLDFVLNAPPLFIPSRKIHSVVTNRLEKFREPTEKWLKNNSVSYDHLIMLDLPSKEDRQANLINMRHKSGYFKKSDAILFVESSQHQSIEIADYSGKPVFSVESNSIVLPGSLKSIWKQPEMHAKNSWINYKTQVKKLITKLK